MLTFEETSKGQDRIYTSSDQLLISGLVENAMFAPSCGQLYLASLFDRSVAYTCLIF